MDFSQNYLKKTSWWTIQHLPQCPMDTVHSHSLLLVICDDITKFNCFFYWKAFTQHNVFCVILHKINIMILNDNSNILWIITFCFKLSNLFSRTIFIRTWSHLIKFYQQKIQIFDCVGLNGINQRNGKISWSFYVGS